ncbi:unnamed protein product [marine sediment metagenome]|uniref:Uncharacterized protein n=1 Tax=marine sediment metagenome TaxID=412755 RepID=X0RNS3_9ZZZZ
MKARNRALIIPEDSPRHFAYESDGNDPLWFKSPSGGKVARLVEWVGEAYSGNTSAIVLTAAGAVGLFWCDRGRALEAVPPSAKQHRGPDGVEAWDEYAEAVLEELEDEGFTARQIIDIGELCMARCNRWLDSMKAAQDRADFTPPPEEPTSV